MLPSQRRGDPVLEMVGILVFVDQHEAEALRVLARELGLGLEDFQQLQEQIVEIHRLRLQELRRVGLLDPREDRVHVPRLHVGLARGEPPILAIRDPVAEGTRLVDLLVEIELLQDAAQALAAIVGVIDGEVVAVADRLRLAAQDPRRHRVER